MKSKVACRIVEISKGADEHNYGILAVARRRRHTGLVLEEIDKSVR